MSAFVELPKGGGRDLLSTSGSDDDNDDDKSDNSMVTQISRSACWWVRPKNSGCALRANVIHTTVVVIVVVVVAIVAVMDRTGLPPLPPSIEKCRPPVNQMLNPDHKTRRSLDMIKNSNISVWFFDQQNLGLKSKIMTGHSLVGKFNKQKPHKRIGIATMHLAGPRLVPEALHALRDTTKAQPSFMVAQANVKVGLQWFFLGGGRPRL